MWHPLQIGIIPNLPNIQNSSANLIIITNTQYHYKKKTTKVVSNVDFTLSLIVNPLYSIPLGGNLHQTKLCYMGSAGVLPSGEWGVERLRCCGLNCTFAAPIHQVVTNLTKNVNLNAKQNYLVFFGGKSIREEGRRSAILHFVDRRLKGTRC